METLDEEVITLVKRLATTIKKVGVKKVVDALDELNTEEGFVEAHQSLIKYILNETSTVFQINPEDMKRKNIRGTAYDARAMCFILLKKQLDLNHKDIAGLFGKKNHTLVSHALTYFNNLDYDVKTDRKFLEAFQEINTKVTAQREKLWLKHS